MEAAKQAIAQFTGRTGHQTEVTEEVQPAITSEVIKPHRHEETTEAVDREVHQHHHHTTVQPLQHKETLPEQHSHNIKEVEKRQYNHDNEQETKLRLQNERSQFKDSSMTAETTHTQSAAQTVAGEHVHHHIHEIVQPVVHKETVQPTVVHTVNPIHEVIHKEAQHHGISALPMKTLTEFENAGGTLKGSKSASHETYDGQPRPYNESLKTTVKEALLPGGGRPARSDSGVGEDVSSRAAGVVAGVRGDSARYAGDSSRYAGDSSRYAGDSARYAGDGKGF